VLVSRDDLGNAPGEEVPDNQATVVATDREKRSPSIERTRQRHRDAVQGSIEFLKEQASKWSNVAQLHNTEQREET
jgi:hypothetical protein